MFATRTTGAIPAQAKRKRMSDNDLPETHKLRTFGVDRVSNREYILVTNMARTIRRTYPDLRRYLAATGQTQAELAARLGLSQAFISKLLRGLIQPSLDEALRIADVVGVPVESLVARDRNILTEK